MNTPTSIRRSPLHRALEGLPGGRWTERNGMRVLARMNAGDEERRDRIALADLSHRPCIGFKGPGACAWFESLGFPLPPPNGWSSLPGGGIVARLAGTEFLVEGGTAEDTVSRIRAAVAQPRAGVYPVWRHDASIAVCGREVHELLVQVCNVDFREVADRVVVMTMMIGVAVIVVRWGWNGVPCYRIWCDPSFAPYLWGALCGIAGEMGGGPIGCEALDVADG